MADKKRIELLDELRGFAITAMIIHHSFLDIGVVFSSGWGYMVFRKLCVAQPLFWAIFILISGICSRLSRNTIKRGAIVLGSGLLITLVTAVIMPKIGMGSNEIYFGILSCLGSCMIITGLLMPLIEKTNTSLGMIITAVLFFFFYGISERTLFFGLIHLPDALYQTNLFMPLGFYNDEFFSADYFAIIPWLFLFLFGAFVVKYAKNGEFPQWTYTKHSKALAFVGRNSLWFYLGHQVVIYAILYAFFYLTILIGKVL